MHNDGVTNHKKFSTQIKQLLTSKTSVQMLLCEKCSIDLLCNIHVLAIRKRSWGWGGNESSCTANDELLASE